MKVRFISLISVFAVLLSFCAFRVYADDGNASGGPEIFDGTDSATVSRLASAVVDNFNMPTIGWEGQCSVHESFDFYPFTPYEGSRSILFSGAVKKSVSDGALDTARYFCVTVFSESDLSLSFRAEGNGFEYYSAAQLKGGEWRTVVFDLDDESSIIKSGRAKGSKISSVTLDAGAGNQVLADLCVGIENTQCGQILEYMCGSFSAEGGTIFENGGAYVFSYGLGGSFSGVPFNTLFPRGSGIELTLENNSTASSLTLIYGTAMGEKSVTAKLLPSSLPQSVLFPVDPGSVSSLRFVPGENTSGQIIITSMRLSPSAVVTDSGKSNSSCVISRDRKSISFSAAVGENYDGCEAYLFALEPGENVSIAGRAAVAQASVSSGNVTFGITIGSSGNEIFRKYVCAVEVGGQLVVMSEPVFPSNSELLARGRSGYVASSVKGSGVTGGEYISDFISHTCVTVNLEELLLVDGSKITVSDSYAAALNEKMSAFARQKILVTAVLAWSVTGDPSIDRLLFTSEGRPSFAAVRAAASYLAETYGTSDGTFCLGGVQLGNNVNETFAATSEGLDSACSYYADMYRTVYIGLKTVNSDLQAYMPLGGRWYRVNGLSARGCFSALQFARAVAEKVTVSGGIPVSISYDVWCGEGTESYISEYISAANLSVLRTASDSLGIDTIILLGGQYASEGNQVILDSAEYAYLYSVICSEEIGIDAIIPLHDCGYADTLRYLDGRYAGEKLKYVGDIYGGGASEKLTKLSITPERNIYESTLLTVVPSSVKGQAELFDFSKSSDGFEASDFCENLLPGVTLGEKEGILSVNLVNTDGYSYKGIEASFDSPLNLSGTEYFGADLMLTKAPEGRDTAGTLIVLRSGESVYFATGQIDDSGFTTLVADISGFEARDEIDGLGIYVLTDGQQTVLLHNVRIMSESYTDDQIIDKVKKAESKPTYPLEKIIAASSAAAVCFVDEKVRIIKRRKKNSSQEV